MYDLKEVAERLKKERIRQNMSIKQLSLLSGVNSIAISRYETGIREISSEAFVRIVFILGIDINELFPYHNPYGYVCERFEYLVRNQDVRSINFIFNTIAAMIGYYEKNSNKQLSSEILRGVHG